MALSALIGLAACGSAVAGGTGHPAVTGTSPSQEPAAAVKASAGVPLCMAAQRVNRVMVSLKPARPGTQFHRIFPVGIRPGDAAQVRALVVALCALPPMPAGLHCPAGFGGAFQLVFAAGMTGFQPVRVQLSGCRAVTGAGPTRWWPQSPQFGQMLSRTLGGTGWLMPTRQASSVPTP